MSDIDIRRRAGTHLRRFTRSNTDYKPVCLWPTEEQRRAREVTAADEADEEMSDYPVTESKANNKIVTHAHAGTPPLPGPEDTTMITTPVNERIQMGFPATPPPTHRQTRSSFKMDMDVTPTVDDPGSSEQFNTWARVKDPDEINLSYHRAGREGSPMRASACVRRTKPAGPLERAQLAKAMRASMADQLEAQAMVETHPTVEVQATVEVHASVKVEAASEVQATSAFQHTPEVQAKSASQHAPDAQPNSSFHSASEDDDFWDIQSFIQRNRGAKRSGSLFSNAGSSKRPRRNLQER